MYRPQDPYAQLLDRCELDSSLQFKVQRLIQAAYPNACWSSNLIQQFNTIQKASVLHRLEQMCDLMKELNLIHVWGLPAESSSILYQVNFLFNCKSSLQSYLAQDIRSTLRVCSFKTKSCILQSTENKSSEVFLIEFWDCKVPKVASDNIFEYRGMSVQQLAKLTQTARRNLPSHLGADLTSLLFIASNL